MRKLFYRIKWLPTLAAFVSIIGVPLLYLTGKSLARLEHGALSQAQFLVDADEIVAFEQLKVSGSGMIVRLGCGDKATASVCEHPDEVFFQQLPNTELFIAGQQLTESKPFQVDLTTSRPINRIDLRNGAVLHVPACAIVDSQLTADLAAGSRLYISGSVRDLFLFGATGSKLLPGEKGHILVERAVVDIVYGSEAQLCGALKVVGLAAAGSNIKVRLDTLLARIPIGVVDCNCSEDGPVFGAAQASSGYNAV